MKKLLLLVWMMAFTGLVKAENGHQLWLRYEPINKAKVTGPACIAAEELKRYSRVDVVLRLDERMEEGEYVISPSTPNARPSTGSGTVSICARDEIGLLYGAYAFLSFGKKHSKPYYKLRILNHWDNLDGTIERGYAGKSIFWPEGDAQLVKEYARANASIGINGTVLNNVNASPKILSAEFLKQVKAYADIMRPYGIKVYLSVNFASPMHVGVKGVNHGKALKTADPLNARVKAWWKAKAKEIYQLIPDFGGFLVKANSEGQPGPFDYHRTHADGANMLADAVKPFGGIIMWRSFVYGAAHKGEDRVKQAVSEFAGLDGQFRDNVILQSKNGPLDFQPREPYAPIFDNIQQTKQMAELQITQEYLGQSRHLVYLAPMWREFFGFVAPEKLVGIAGVANIGLDKNWCGHHFSQANWYAFGRLAWDPTLTSEEIANEWLAQTFELNAPAEEQLQSVMLRSREACVDYMMPIGLHHIFAFDEHYGPEPGGYIAHYPIEWCPVYYHKANNDSIGFDRTHTGSNATAQYREPYCTLYDNVNTCPERFLLWFHRVPWSYRLKSGRTVLEEMDYRYARGVKEVEDFIGVWNAAKPCIDEQRWQEVDARLQHQLENAKEWQKVCMDYFGSFKK